MTHRSINDRIAEATGSKDHTEVARLLGYGSCNDVNGAVVDVNDELSWYYGASSFELGMSSCFDAMIVKLQTHGAQFTCQEPVGPSPRMLAAARKQIQVRQALRALPTKLQATLEVAYSDRRYSPQVASAYGPGCVGIAVRAGLLTKADGATVASRIEEAAGREADGKPEARIKAASQALLAQAKAAYLEARHGPPPKPKRKRAPVLKAVKPVRLDGYRPLAVVEVRR